MFIPKSLTPFVVVGLLAGCSSDGSRHQMFALKNKPAPDFELAALDGGRVRLSEFRGKPVLLAFFGCGCPPCRAEAPHLSALQEKHAADGLVVLAVNQWDESKEEVTKFVAQRKLQQRVLLNGGAVGTDLYHVEGVPTCFWIDRSGVVIDSLVDFDGPGPLERKTKELIARR